ncbi:hypothetical protein GYH30_044438 [Glycine max]|nr:hypothetical protein GYH30_044438 [Glycine max]
MHLVLHAIFLLAVMHTNIINGGQIMSFLAIKLRGLCVVVDALWMCTNDYMD